MSIGFRLAIKQITNTILFRFLLGGAFKVRDPYVINGDVYAYVTAKAGSPGRQKDFLET